LSNGARASARLQSLADLLIISGTANRHRTADLDEIDAVFSALAHAARRQIILLLSYHGPELPSGYLAHRFSHSWPTTTRHLNILQRAGVVAVRREGRTSHYRLNRPLLERVIGGWLENLTPPSPDQTWASGGPKFTSELRRQRKSRPKGTPP
jgi:DNA-binding transcriptional ArsR family regulator